jgi:hypothetical protein
MPQRENPGDGGHNGQHHQNTADQHELVVRTELAYREVLCGRRCQVDQGGADGEFRCGGRTRESGDQFTDAQRYRCGENSEQGAESALLAHTGDSPRTTARLGRLCFRHPELPDVEIPASEQAV